MQNTERPGLRARHSHNPSHGSVLRGGEDDCLGITISTRGMAFLLLLKIRIMPSRAFIKRERMRHARAAIGGFTLIEAMVASGVMALFVTACFTAITFDQVAVRKSKEESIAMDFLIHYLENVKALPFSYVAPGQPINPLLNGTAGAPAITLPANYSWVPVTTLEYQSYHPDLLWISNRNPALLVVITSNSVGGDPARHGGECEN